MPNKKRNPAAVATARGARGIAVSRNTSITQTATAANPFITSIRRAPPVGKVDWLVSIEGICTDTPIRDRKLRRYRRFCAAIKYRFRVALDPMPQSDWSAIVEAAIAKAGAS
jgi:hypothetical protein